MNRPKRRKHKDNPYILEQINNLYIIKFKDSHGIIQRLEITEELFRVFDRFELDDLKELNEYDNHIEHSEIFYNNLNQRAFNKGLNLEDEVFNKIEYEKLNYEINKLPLIQKRRLKMYYLENKTLDQIAHLENCSKMVVKFSIDIVLEKISKKFQI